MSSVRSGAREVTKLRPSRVTGLLAVIIFWIPVLFDWVVNQIGRRPDQPDNIGRGPR